MKTKTLVGIGLLACAGILYLSTSDTAQPTGAGVAGYGGELATWLDVPTKKDAVTESGEPSFTVNMPAPFPTLATTTPSPDTSRTSPFITASTPMSKKELANLDTLRGMYGDEILRLPYDSTKRLDAPQATFITTDFAIAQYLIFGNQTPMIQTTAQMLGLPRIGAEATTKKAAVSASAGVATQSAPSMSGGNSSPVGTNKIIASSSSSTTTKKAAVVAHTNPALNTLKYSLPSRKYSTRYK